MTREEEVRALLAVMRATVRDLRPETRIGAEMKMEILSWQVATLSAECSLPELDWWKHAVARS